MASANFAASLDAVLKHEGGWSDHPADPGGATNLGITLATLAAYRGRKVTKADVKALTKQEAGRIYRDKYWDTVRGNDLPKGLDFAVFDYAVNSGPSRAAKALQAILGVPQDGKIGPLTLAAATVKDTQWLIAAYCRKRLSFLERLKTWRVFGRGWKRRVKETEALAFAMAGK